ELVAKRKDGSMFDVQLSTSMVIDESGKPICMMASFVDITERKRAEEALQESEGNLRTYLESAPDGVYINDSKGTFLYGNKRAEEITGYKREELIGKSFLKLSLFPPKYLAKAVKLLALNTMGKPTGPDEFELIRKDGSRIWIEITTAPIKQEGETVVIGFARDITEHKQAEEREKQLQQELILTGRLASVGQMAAGIAHEINNPLTGVVGFSRLLMKKKDIPEGIRKDVSIINEGAQRIADITSGMLTYARQQKPEQTSVNINDVIEATLAMRAYEMESSSIKVTTQLASDMPLTFADAGQLQQVFLNVILNAETEMINAHGKGSLSVKTERIDNTIRVSFKDDGPGIPKKNLERIFDPFFSTRDPDKGA
ncbi:MAG: PAS domain S-box protein, partial [Dehalococcoidales bacterium]